MTTDSVQYFLFNTALYSVIYSKYFISFKVSSTAPCNVMSQSSSTTLLYSTCIILYHISTLEYTVCTILLKYNI